jgi:hypothetical protein
LNWRGFGFVGEAATNANGRICGDGNYTHLEGCPSGDVVAFLKFLYLVYRVTDRNIAEDARFDRLVYLFGFWMGIEPQLAVEPTAFKVCPFTHPNIVLWVVVEEEAAAVVEPF